MLTATQTAVTAGSAASLGRVPRGAVAALSIPSGVAYVGTDSTVTVTSGAPVTGYALLPRLPSASPCTLWAVAAAGTVAVGLIIAADY